MNIKRKGPLFDGGTCRCCGVTKKCRLLNVEYEFCGQKEIYFDMFVDCFGLVSMTIHNHICAKCLSIPCASWHLSGPCCLPPDCLSHMEGEELERLICATCVMRLRDAYAFRKQVLQCEEKLLQLQMQDDISKPTNDKLEVKVEMEDTTYTDNDYEPDSNQTAPDQEDINLHRPIIMSKIKVDAKKERNATAPVRRRMVQRSKIAEALRAKREMLLRLKRMKEKLIALQKPKTSASLSAGPNRIWNATKPKPFHNIITLIENSYVCPFFTTFNSHNCVYCKEMFVNPIELREHTLSHDPRFYKVKVVYKNDLQIDISRIDCRLCPEKINNLQVFYRHITRVHNKKIFPNIKNEFLKFKLKLGYLCCLECKGTFPNFVALKKHMAEHFGAYICDACGDHFFDEELLFAHKKLHRKLHESSFSCEECGKIYRTKRGIETHVSRAHTQKPIYNCNQCSEIFFTQILRQKHKAAVHGDSTKVYFCEECDKVYDRKKSYHAHRRSNHTKNWKHECQVCGSKFYQHSLLRDHISRIHGKREKKFKCELCGKRYSTKGGLLSHTYKKHDDNDDD